MTFFSRILMRPCLVLGLTLFGLSAIGAEPARVASIEPEDLVEYESAPEEVRELIDYALDLTKEELCYRFGSNRPEEGGMDCSGTVQHVLQAAGFEGAPRSSYGIHQWARNEEELVSTKGVRTIDDPIFDGLRPGDLLFWEGTYETEDRDPPISHVMIYLGTLEKDGKGVVFGASSGRRYRGRKIHGVSVFDWRVPSPLSKSKLVAYGSIPGTPDE